MKSRTRVIVFTSLVMIAVILASLFFYLRNRDLKDSSALKNDQTYLMHFTYLKNHPHGLFRSEVAFDIGAMYASKGKADSAEVWLMESVKGLEKKASQDNQTEAQWRYGRLCQTFFNSVNMQQSIDKAAELYEKSAKANSPDGQNLHGYVLYYIKNDRKAGLTWWEKAAQQGQSDAQYQLGFNYENGYDFAKNPEKAVYWYELAAKQGQFQAQYSLGTCYLDGFGVEPDKEKAKYWLELSAKQNWTDGQMGLGRFYILNDEYQKALYWLEKSAAQDNTIAMYLLGELHFNGLGTAEDPEKGIQLISQAAEKGYGKARDRMKEFENQIGVFE